MGERTPGNATRRRTLTEEMVFMRTKCNRLDLIKNLNLWGNDLHDISVLQHMPNLEVLSLSVNRVNSLVDLCHCSKLSELYLRKNDICDLADVRHLKPLRNLRVLWLSDNPCATLPHYRLYVLQQLPHLTKLDAQDVTNDERRHAADTDLRHLSTKVDIPVEEEIVLERAKTDGWTAGPCMSERDYTNGRRPADTIDRHDAERLDRMVSTRSDAIRHNPPEYHVPGRRREPFSPSNGLEEDEIVLERAKTEGWNAGPCISERDYTNGRRPADAVDRHDVDRMDRMGSTRSDVRRHTAPEHQIPVRRREPYTPSNGLEDRTPQPTPRLDPPDVGSPSEMYGMAHGRRREPARGDMHGDMLGDYRCEPGPDYSGRADNILCAVLALIKELDQQGLELVRRAVEQRQHELSEPMP